jgi:CheY-like chemotaxis protein
MMFDMDAHTMRGTLKVSPDLRGKPARPASESGGDERKRESAAADRHGSDVAQPRNDVLHSVSPSAATGGAAVHAATSAETVLVVEDNDLVRKLAVRLLDRFGYRVREAASPAEALARLEGVHLLMTDLLLPGGPMGTELAMEARRHNADLAVLLTTGECLPASLGREKGYSMLYKPYTMQQLLQAVRNALDMRAKLPHAAD